MSLQLVLLNIAIQPALSQALKERIAFQRKGTATSLANVVVMFTDDTPSTISAVDLADSTACSYPRVTPSANPRRTSISLRSKAEGWDELQNLHWASMARLMPSTNRCG